MKYFLFDDGAGFSIDSSCEGDDHLFDACINGSKGILDLGNHSSADGAISLISDKILVRDSWNN